GHLRHACGYHRFLAEEAYCDAPWLYIAVSDHTKHTTVAQQVYRPFERAEIQPSTLFFVHRKQFEAARSTQVGYEIGKPGGLDAGYDGTHGQSASGDNLRHYIERPEVRGDQDNPAPLLLQGHNALPAF